MGVKFGITRGEMRKQPRDIGFVHARVLQQAKDGLRVPDAALGQGRPGARGKRMKNGGMKGAIGELAGSQAQV